MNGTDKISLKNLLVCINNVINACDLSSVTPTRVKKYLQHRFKDALPCDNDLDIILKNVIKSVKLSQALNGDFDPLEDGEELTKNVSHAFAENENSNQAEPIKKRTTKSTGYVTYTLKKGMDSGGGKAYSYSVKNSLTSRPIRIIKPFVTKKKVSAKDTKVLCKSKTKKITSERNQDSSKIFKDTPKAKKSAPKRKKDSVKNSKVASKTKRIAPKMNKNETTKNSSEIQDGDPVKLKLHEITPANSSLRTRANYEKFKDILKNHFAGEISDSELEREMKSSKTAYEALCIIQDLVIIKKSTSNLDNSKSKGPV